MEFIKFAAVLLLTGFAAFVQAQIKRNQMLVISIDANDKEQIIKNIGVSGCWYSEAIGKYWPAEKKERMAELLFSKNMDQQGNPMGIGVSAFRFNIGGGTAEQGIAGGIGDPNRRVECFLDKYGNYDWSKQAGYQWFLQKAKVYGVENLIAFSNTPPVQFTLNGLGFKTEKDGIANLKPTAYILYADFLAATMKHFDDIGLHFNYVSPVNEPQWDWTGNIGSAKQEGSPWKNEEIYTIVKALDSTLSAKKLTTKIVAPEAAMLSFLYEGNTGASKQIATFFSAKGAHNLLNFKSVLPTVAGHSYFTDANDSMLVGTRKKLADTAKKYGVDFWQSEYSMLGNGYKEGTKGKRSQMDCALFLAKVIHHDLTIGNATAWHLWNAYEPGNADHDTRYYLLALKPDSDFKNGTFTVTKNLWGLGHFSLFIRPGMQRLNTMRSDNMSDVNAAQDLMVSAYKDNSGKMVLVAINYAATSRQVKINLQHADRINSIKSYVTTASQDDNMRVENIKNMVDVFTFQPRSITTIVIN